MKKTIASLLAFLAFMPMLRADKTMDTFIDALMHRMTLQEKIGQLNLQVAGDITTGSAMDTEVSALIAA
ncbi:MAG: hypothetical protein IK092_07865, partial [Muribaculaceae bacterium]|nr:hypothetical protein [Muribaculaceae bacterium]